MIIIMIHHCPVKTENVHRNGSCRFEKTHLHVRLAKMVYRAITINNPPPLTVVSPAQSEIRGTLLIVGIFETPEFQPTLLIFVYFFVFYTPFSSDFPL